MDPDTPPENLTITVATPDSGFLSLASNLSHPVSSFTQADVNNRRLYFTHTGACVIHPWEGIGGTGNNECFRVLTLVGGTRVREEVRMDYVCSLIPCQTDRQTLNA